MDENLKMKSICIELAEIGNEGCKRKIQWDLRARRTLADFLDLVKLSKLEADVNIVKTSGDPKIFVLKGDFRASFVQECVVCMGPISVSLKENVSAKFVPTRRELNREDIFTHLDEDDPEVYSGDLLEIGKLVQDQLSLSIETYPRHKRSECAPLGGGANSTGVSSRNLPFAGLRKLLNRSKKKPIE